MSVLDLKFLDRSLSVASEGFSRWIVPPAALAVHICIGQIYAYSVFNKPMTKIIGITESSPEDWKLTTIGWIFSIALFVLGASAAFFGRWVEREGPRKAMFWSAVCFSFGFFISAVGVFTHQIFLIYLGHGVVGGIGLGLGYISPVSTLIKWFPDKPGMATGMAIMGFGGGAMVASPLSKLLMDNFSSATSIGVGETFIVMGFLYLLLMMFGSAIVRVPKEGWKPKGWEGNKKENKLISKKNVLVGQATKTPQFYFVFFVLMLNVTAGIGVLGQASVMIQEMFSEKVVGKIKAVTAIQAAGFVGLLSLFNMLGRFFWASISDYIGRKNTYTVYFILGIILYASVPAFGNMGSVFLFVVAFLIIMSMYGGGFATVPAYLKDLFGVINVGAIHGRLLLAWSTAALLGPSLVNYIRQGLIDAGNPPSQAYSLTMYIMSGLLVLGLICNLMVKPVNEKHHHD